MRERRYILKHSILAAYILSFIILYFIFLINFFVIPNNFINKISNLTLFGFILVIIVFFLFFNLNHDYKNFSILKFKFLSENFFKFSFLFLMSFLIFFPPITFSTMIISWNEISIFNYLKAIISLLGSAFIPGMCLYNIFLHNIPFQNKLKAHPIFIKGVLYPLLSFSYIGIVVMLINRFGLLHRAFFTSTLFFSILVLILIDIVLQIRRRKNNTIISLGLKQNHHYFDFKYILIIIFLSIGVMLISIGANFATNYSLTGDTWKITSLAYYVDSSRNDLINYGYSYSYPIFWAYIVYGLSILMGIPYINVNMLLAPFSYLFIFSLYLFIKAILHKFKEVYSVLSLILTSIFSGLFIFFTTNHQMMQSNIGNISNLLFFGIIYFLYKSFAYCLTFVSLALLISVTRNDKLICKQDQSFNKIRKKNYFKMIFLGIFFSIISYMVYMLPQFSNLYILFLFFIIFKNGYDKIIVKYIIIIFILLFTIFDFLLGNLLCSLLYTTIIYYFIPGIEINGFLRPVILYCFLYGFLTLYLLKSKSLKSDSQNKQEEDILYMKEDKDSQKLTPKEYLMLALKIRTYPIDISIKKKKKGYNKLKKIKFNHKRIFLFSILFFTIFLLLEVFIIITREFNYSFSDNLTQYYIFFYLDLILLNIGFIGVIAIYLSYFSYKKEKKIFYFLILWIVFSIFFASILIFKNYFLFYTIPKTPNNEYDMAVKWFTRIWYDSIPAFSILAAIGLIDLGNKVKNLKTTSKIKKNSHYIRKNAVVSILIFLSLSNLIFNGMYRANTTRKLYDDQAQVIGWISDNILQSSRIVLYNSYYPLWSGLTRISKLKGYYVSQLPHLEDPKIVLDFLMNESIEYALFYDYEKSVLESKYSINFTNTIFDFFNITLFTYKNLSVYSSNDLKFID